jgi:hypothetical protein
MRRVLLGLLLVAFVPVVGAQNSSNRDVPIHGEFRIDNPRVLHQCAGGIPVDQIARRAHVLVGFENTPGCWLSPRSLGAGDGAEVLTGMTARQALDHLVALMPAYRWKEMDGVAVVRPTSAWDDPTDVLNTPEAPFSVTDTHLSDVLDVVLDAARPSLFYPHTGRRSGTPIDQPVSVAFRGGRVIDALNAVILARQGAEWQFGYGGHAMITVGTLELSGGDVIVPLASQQQTR